MIRPMERADIPRVAEIHTFARRVAYRGAVPDGFLFGDQNSVQTRAKAFADEFGKNGRAGFVWDDGIIRGFLIVAPTGEDLELERIFVDPLMFGEGLGRKLSAFCDEYAKQKGLKQIYLWVLEANHSARGFYENVGYRMGSSRTDQMGEATPMVRYVKDVKVYD